MKKVTGYLLEYFRNEHKGVLALASLLTAVFVFCNYRFHLNARINRQADFLQYLAWYGVFLAAFGSGYLIQQLVTPKATFHNKRFLALLLVAPAIFSWKMATDLHFHFANDVFKDEYWNAVVYWPYKVLVVSFMLYLVYRATEKDRSFYGVSLKGFSLKPYLWMLLVMVPLVAAASTQKDFLRMYPRMQSLEYLLQPSRGWHRILYELSYGTDFFSIELFFRGFLVLAFARWAGKGAILPMAMFYCTIHFGKPLGECISSYFGGMILGVVSYHTRSIFGGFLVHVGIAWLMEAGGFLGHLVLT